MGWIFHSKKGWGLIQISGSNHQSGMPRFTSFRPQIPQNQAASPTRTGAAATGTCLPARGTSQNQQQLQPAGRCQALRNSCSAPWPGKHGQQAMLLKPEIPAKPKGGFWAQARPPTAGRALCALHQEGIWPWGGGMGGLGYNELFLNFPVTTMLFRRQGHTA